MIILWRVFILGSCPQSGKKDSNGGILNFAKPGLMIILDNAYYKDLKLSFVSSPPSLLLSLLLRCSTFVLYLCPAQAALRPKEGPFWQYEWLGLLPTHWIGETLLTHNLIGWYTPASGPISLNGWVQDDKTQHQVLRDEIGTAMTNKKSRAD